jgi:hypothetical protein
MAVPLGVVVIRVILERFVFVTFLGFPGRPPVRLLAVLTRVAAAGLRSVSSVDAVTVLVFLRPSGVGLPATGAVGALPRSTIRGCRGLVPNLPGMVLRGVWGPCCGGVHLGPGHGQADEGEQRDPGDPSAR